MDAEPHMWSYWRDKKGTLEAVSDYYPQLLREDKMIGFLHMQATAALAQLDARMTQLGLEEDDEA